MEKRHSLQWKCYANTGVVGSVILVTIFQL